MGHHLIAWCPIRDRVSYAYDYAGGLDAEGNRRSDAYIPAARADDLIPAGHAGRPEPDQHLVLGERTWLRHVDHLHTVTDTSNSGYEHFPSSPSSLVPGVSPREMIIGRLARPASPSRTRVVISAHDASAVQPSKLFTSGWTGSRMGPSLVSFATRLETVASCADQRPCLS